LEPLPLRKTSWFVFGAVPDATAELVKTLKNIKAFLRRLKKTAKFAPVSVKKQLQAVSLII
jgi:hypothetical protein